MSRPCWKLRLDASRTVGFLSRAWSFQPLCPAPWGRARCPLLCFLLLAACSSLPLRPVSPARVSDPAPPLERGLSIGAILSPGAHSPVSGDSGQREVPGLRQVGSRDADQHPTVSQMPPAQQRTTWPSVSSAQAGSPASCPLVGALAVTPEQERMWFLPSCSVSEDTFQPGGDGREVLRTYASPLRAWSQAGLS